MKTTYLFAALVCFFCYSVLPVSAKSKKKTPVTEQKIALGVWDDVDKTASVDSIIRWMKPFDEAGIKNYYMCGSPEEVARYIEAAKSYPGGEGTCLDVYGECSPGFCGIGASGMV